VAIVMDLLERLIVGYAVHLPAHPGKWRVVNALLRWTGVGRRRRTTPVIARRQGVDWKLSTDCWVQRTLFFHGEWDANELEALLRHMPDRNGTASAVFLDIGAYFGYYALTVARRLGLAVTVFAFEPLTVNYDLLTDNIRRNRFSNVTPVRAALSDAPGEAVFTVPPAENRGSGHLRTAGETGDGERVPVTTLDRFMEERAVPRLSAIKLDVEGAELGVLRGGRETLQRFHPVLLMELNPTALGEHGTAAADLLGLLTELGYRVFEVTKDGPKPFTATDLPARHDLVRGYTNLLCLPR
jgi:FkbM family methyltransferase